MGLNPEGHFEAQGLSRAFWQPTGPIREIFKEAFEAAGLPYSNPHLFRDSLAAFGMRHCKTPEEFKAWSQNIGHKGVLTTFTNYGPVSLERQAELIVNIRPGREDQHTHGLEAARALIEREIMLKNSGRASPVLPQENKPKIELA